MQSDDYNSVEQIGMYWKLSQDPIRNSLESLLINFHQSHLNYVHDVENDAQQHKSCWNVCSLIRADSPICIENVAKS